MPYLGLALIGQDLQGLQVWQALVVVKQNTVVSCGCTDWVVAQTCPLFLFGFLQHLKNQVLHYLSDRWRHIGFLWVSACVCVWVHAWLSDAVFCIRVLVFLKPGSLSARTVMVFFPMNSRASKPPLITDLPWETNREGETEMDEKSRNDEKKILKVNEHFQILGLKFACKLELLDTEEKISIIYIIYYLYNAISKIYF